MDNELRGKVYERKAKHELYPDFIRVSEVSASGGTVYAHSCNASGHPPNDMEWLTIRTWRLRRDYCEYTAGDQK